MKNLLGRYFLPTNSHFSARLEPCRRCEWVVFEDFLKCVLFVPNGVLFFRKSSPIPKYLGIDSCLVNFRFRNFPHRRASMAPLK